MIEAFQSFIQGATATTTTATIIPATTVTAAAAATTNTPTTTTTTITTTTTTITTTTTTTTTIGTTTTSTISTATTTTTTTSTTTSITTISTTITMHKRARNTVNEIKTRKSNYYKEVCFTHKKDPSKLWSTINEVCSKKPKSTDVKNLEIDNQKLTNSAAMAEAFNEHFSTIGCKLTDAIGSANSAESFLEYFPTANSVFSIEPTSSAKVLELMLKLSKQKAIGLDGISSQLIKISAPVIVASITEIFNCSILTGIFPDEWKAARVTPVSKVEAPVMLTTTDLFQLFP